jgi:catechol 2,3-dioxygenase-like lactoylglutathione lyase family enzyme
MAIAHITLATRNVRQSRDFFVNALGWRPIEHPGNIDVDAAWLEIADGQQLHLVRVDDFQVSPFEREFGRHVAVSFPQGEFDVLKSRLVEHGATLIDPLRDTPFPRFFFREPNGYIFEVVPSR